MSKTEILTELPKLTPEERQEVRELLAEIDGTDWLDDGELTDEEKALIDTRLDECESNPSSFVPWDEAKARISAPRYCRAALVARSVRALATISLISFIRVGP